MESKQHRNIVMDIKKILRQAEINFHHFKIGQDVTEINFGIRGENCNLRTRIIVNQSKNNVRVCVILPVCLNNKYAYPFFEYIGRKNNDFRFGKINVTDENEVLFEYAFPPDYDYTDDNFLGVTSAIIYSADEEYEKISRFCIGKFTKKERRDICRKSEELIEELSEEDENGIDTPWRRSPLDFLTEDDDEETEEGDDDKNLSDLLDSFADDGEREQDQSADNDDAVVDEMFEKFNPSDEDE